MHRIATLALSALLFTSAAGAESISLRDVVVKGMKNNLNIQAEEQAVQAVKTGTAVADSRFDTTFVASTSLLREKSPDTYRQSTGEYYDRSALSASAGVVKEFENGLSASVTAATSVTEHNRNFEKLDERYTSSLLLNITLPLLKGAGVEVNRTQIKLAEKQTEAAQFGYLARVHALTEQIELAYLELARSQAVLAERIEAKRLAEELLAANRKRFSAGVAPVSDVQQAETALASREEQIIAARERAEMAANSLTALTLERITAEMQATIPTATGELQPEEELLKLAFTGRPELKERRLGVESADIRLAFTDNKQLPRLDLVGTLGTNGLAGGEKTPTKFEGEYHDSLLRMAEADGYQWQVGVNFSMPLGNRTAKAELRKAQFEKKQLILTYKATETAVESEVRASRIRIERSRDRIAVAERYRNLAEITLHQETKRLAEGLSDTFKVLEYQNTLIEARIRMLNAQADYQAGKIALARATGAILGDLNMIPSFTENK